MADIILLPVEFVKPTFKVDRSVGLYFETRELTGIEAAILVDARQTEGWLAYGKNEKDVLAALEDIPDNPADPDLQKKSASQRLRNVLYVFWEQKGKPGRWEDFYATQLERLIDTIKSKLEPSP